MKECGTSLEEWRALYDEAIAFLKLAPWEWVDDTDLFGVQDPESGEIAWCSVMGGLGQFYALGAYLGSEGLDTYLRIASREATEEEALFQSKMLMASFEDRNSVDAEDRKIIKQLGLKLRGRNGWVVFRRHDPGYFPWYVDRDDVRLLTIVLQQAIVVARQAADDPFHILSEEEGAYLVRVPVRGPEGISWGDECVRPETAARKSQKPAVGLSFDQVRTQRLKGTIPKGDSTVEMALVPFPMPIREKDERPCFPMVFIVLDHENGLALETEMFPMPAMVTALPELVLAFLEKSQSLPQRILIEDGTLHELLKPIGKALGITLKKERKLPHVSEIKADLLMHLAPF
ncbi:MAG: hypothetical protein AB9873_04160 [Syntrophobacteraceae bacterium]